MLQHLCKGLAERKPVCVSPKESPSVWKAEVTRTLRSNTPLLQFLVVQQPRCQRPHGSRDDCLNGKRRCCLHTLPLLYHNFQPPFGPGNLYEGVRASQKSFCKASSIPSFFRELLQISILLFVVTLPDHLQLRLRASASLFLSAANFCWYSSTACSNRCWSWVRCIRYCSGE